MNEQANKRTKDYKVKNVITWKNSQNSEAINLTPSQEKMLDDARAWPLYGSDGFPFCQIGKGLHRGRPSYSDDEIKLFIANR